MSQLRVRFSEFTGVSVTYSSAHPFSISKHAGILHASTGRFPSRIRVTDLNLEKPKEEQLPTNRLSSV